MSIADGENPLHSPLALFLLQVVFIVTVARMVGAVLKFVKRMWKHINT